MNFSLSLIISLVVSIIIGYLLGSINFAIIITKIFAKDDIRKFGSGNAGMTNVLRTLGKGPAALTLLGDFFKGIAAVLIARLLFTLIVGSSPFILCDYFAIYGALLGHVFPIYYGFKGGKGILVSFGAIMVLSPLSGLICLAAFLILVIWTKYVSLGSIIAAVIFPLAILLLNVIYKGSVGYEFLLALPVSLLVIYMHRTNIKRLLSHTENKISFKKKTE